MEIREPFHFLFLVRKLNLPWEGREFYEEEAKANFFTDFLSHADSHVVLTVALKSEKPRQPFS